MGQDRVEHIASTDQLDGRTFVRPNFTQRANRRFPFVLIPFLLLNLVQVIKSGVSAWGALQASLTSAYGTVIAAAVVTLLIAMVPGKSRQLP